MGKPKYVAISPGRADQKHVDGMGKAVLLHDFFVNWQTDEDGRVFYGKPISYQWIQKRFPGSKLRSLERWTARLREGGYIVTERRTHGFTVRIRNQKKWPARQLCLFTGEPVCIASGKRAEIRAK